MVCFAKDPRKELERILCDRWNLDQMDGWDEYGQETLDEINTAYMDYYCDR